MQTRHPHRWQQPCSLNTAALAPYRLTSRRRQRRGSTLLVLGAALFLAAAACSGPTRSGGSRPHGLAPSKTTTTRPPRLTTGPTEYLVHVPRGPAGPLAPNTCVAFAPAHPTGQATVFLDPGHGGYDPGTQSRSKSVPTEKQFTLAIGLKVRDRLVHDGNTAVMSRIADNNVAAVEPGDVSGATETPEYLHRDLLARNECADASNASAVVGIHIDSDSDPSAAGSETIYCAERAFGRFNLTLAKLVENDVVAAVRHSGFDLSSRGVLRDNAGVGGPGLTSAAKAYGHLVLLGPGSQPENPTPTAMPAALVEPLFLTNPAEANYGASPAGQSAIAAGITQAIETFLQDPRRAAKSGGSQHEGHPVLSPLDPRRWTPSP